MALECPRVEPERGELLKEVASPANSLTQGRWGALSKREQVLFTATLKKWPKDEERVAWNMFEVASHGWKRLWQGYNRPL